MHRQDDDSDTRVLGLYDPCGINAVEDWHGNVHQHYFWSVLHDCLDCSMSIFSLSYDLQVGFFPEHVAYRPPVHWAIVDNNNPNRCSYHNDPFLREQNNDSLPLITLEIHGVKTVFVRQVEDRQEWLT